MDVNNVEQPRNDLEKMQDMFSCYGASSLPITKSCDEHDGDTDQKAHFCEDEAYQLLPDISLEPPPRQGVDPLTVGHFKVARELHLVRVLKEPPLRVVDEALLCAPLELARPLQAADEAVLGFLVHLPQLVVGPAGNVVGVDIVLDLVVWRGSLVCQRRRSDVKGEFRHRWL